MVRLRVVRELVVVEGRLRQRINRMHRRRRVLLVEWGLDRVVLVVRQDGEVVCKAKDSSRAKAKCSRRVLEGFMGGIGLRVVRVVWVGGSRKVRDRTIISHRLVKDNILGIRKLGTKGRFTITSRGLLGSIGSSDLPLRFLVPSYVFVSFLFCCSYLHVCLCLSVFFCLSIIRLTSVSPHSSILYVLLTDILQHEIGPRA